MTDDDILCLFMNNSGKFMNSRFRSSKFFTEDVEKYIENRTSFAPKDTPLIVKLYLIKEKHHSFPKCICGKNVKFTGGKFTEFCSYKCSNKNTHILKQEKTEQTNLERYGVKNPFGNKEIQEKIKNTNLERYGVENIGSLSLKIIDNDDLLKRYKDGETYSEIGKALKISEMTVRKNLIDNDIDVSETRKRYSSQEESKICSFLEKNGINFIRNYRKIGTELDIFIPEHNLAIEVNGVWFHSNVFKTPSFHLNKTSLCEKNNIQLLHFWDFEINENLELITSMISSKLKLTNKIYARHCEIKIVSKKEEKKFLEENHIQGYVGSSICYGLYFNKKLMSLMSFSKSRFSDYDFELLRFCTLKGFTVVGGASKLLNIFTKNNQNKSLISYANKRFSNGNMYKSIGFTFSHDSNPNYFYFKKSTKLESRIKYQKHKLEKILKEYDPDLSEKQNMIKNKWNYVYDCGNSIWIKK